MLLYIMLYIMLACLLWFAALSNAVCVYNDFCFHALSWFIDTVCLFQVLFCIMLSAFYLLVFP